MRDDNTSAAFENVDDQLAEFADRVLDGEQLEVLEMVTKDQELHALQETVISIKRAFGDDRPDDAMSNRIRANLAAEWRRAGLDAPAVPVWQRWWRQIAGDKLSWRSASDRRRSYALVMAGAAALVLLVALPLCLSSTNGGAMPGAVGSQTGLIPVIVVLGFGLVGGIVWWVIRRRK